VFSWPYTLFLYAIVLNRIHQTEDFPRRLRVLRNLVEASSNELRLERMPALLADVRRIVVEGALEGVSAFNQAQLADEQLKAELKRWADNLPKEEDHSAVPVMQLDNFTDIAFPTGISAPEPDSAEPGKYVVVLEISEDIRAQVNFEISKEGDPLVAGFSLIIEGKVQG
jgi:hypothetical protein